MTDQERHPEIEELVAYARGALSRKRRRAVRAHCEVCPSCNLDLAKTLVLRADHRRALRQRARRQRLMAAATVVLVLGAAGTIMLGAYFTDPSAELAALATSEPLPEHYVRYRFGTGMPASSDLTAYQLRRGIEALVAEEYGPAIDAFEAVLSEQPSDIETAAYLGIALYLSGDDSTRTQTLLVRGTSHARPELSRAATWYLANLFLRSGEAETAATLLEQLDLGELDDRYSRRARELLQQIEDVPSR